MTTETMPAVVPLEPTTPIKPSEAIRLGLLLAPEPSEGHWGEGTSACANRALVLGLLGDDGGYPRYTEADRALGDVEPPCGWDCLDGWYLGGGEKKRSPSWVLIHLTDAPNHRWSRERIADWLEGLGL